MATKSNKIGIWVVLIVVLVVAAGVIYFLMPKKSATGSGSSLSTSSATSSVFPMKYGAKGDEVLELQKALNDALIADEPFIAGPANYPESEIAEDGVWGNDTEAMVQWAFGGSGVVTEALYTKYII